MLKISTLEKEYYGNALSWIKFYRKNRTLESCYYDTTWLIMFTKLFADKKFKLLEEKIKKIVENDKDIRIFPLPEYIFSAFLITPLTKLKVVFIGQDPYFNNEYDDSIKKYVPQAHGLSFSVPTNISIPSSLNNIYLNLMKYGHIKNKPSSGNLWFWASQGCLMLNTALTVEHGEKESHMAMWEWFTDYIIEYISRYTSDIIFVLWGAHAYKKISLINLDKHQTIVSSHPSGLSVNKPFRNYPAFAECNHFGKINDILKKSGKTQIIW